MNDKNLLLHHGINLQNPSKILTTKATNINSINSPNAQLTTRNPHSFPVSRRPNPSPSHLSSHNLHTFNTNSLIISSTLHNLIHTLIPDPPSSLELSKLSYPEVIPPPLECANHHYKEKASSFITVDLSVVMNTF